MHFDSALEPACVVRRVGRFTVEVERRGERVQAHVANSGRIRELLAPGSPALLRPAANPDRQTAYDLVLVQTNSAWVSADASLPNALLREALEAGRIAPLHGFSEIQSEVSVGGSRIDFVLTGLPGRCLVEVKSVTLVEDGVAIFPDAPSGRAVRHMLLLSDAVTAGDAAAIVFVVQRPDAAALRPNDALDPAFGLALRQAAAGVLVLAYRCNVSPEAIELAHEIPVLL
jgi:sugar fermentation stimulation protein A